VSCACACEDLIGTVGGMTTLHRAPRLTYSQTNLLDTSDTSRRAVTALLWPQAIVIADELAHKPHLIKKVPATWVRHVLALVDDTVLKAAIAADSRLAVRDAARRRGFLRPEYQLYKSLLWADARTWPEMVGQMLRANDQHETLGAVGNLLRNGVHETDPAQHQAYVSLLVSLVRREAGVEIDDSDLVHYVLRPAPSWMLVGMLLELASWNRLMVETARALPHWSVTSLLKSSRPLPPIDPDVIPGFRQGAIRYDRLPGEMLIAAHAGDKVALARAAELDTPVLVDFITRFDGPELRPVLVSALSVKANTTLRGHVVYAIADSKRLLDTWGDDPRLVELISNHLADEALSHWADRAGDTELETWAANQTLDRTDMVMRLNNSLTLRRLVGAMVRCTTGFAYRLLRGGFLSEEVAEIFAVEMCRALGDDPDRWCLAAELLEDSTLNDAAQATVTVLAA
jgi:hypothetical protein